ncbi:MAG: class I SAM-dependent methyltransferase [Candidatus Adiutrix sp.]
MANNNEGASSAWLNDELKRLERKNAFDGSLIMGTAKFNRETGRLEPVNRPFLWAIDKETGLIRADLVRVRRCPVCGELPGDLLFIKDGFRHVRCLACGLIYVSLILRDNVLEKFWREEAAWMNVLNSGPQMEIDRLKFQYGLDVVTPHIHGRTVLDIGSGNGTFVRIAKEAGWQPTALDLNQDSNQKLAADGFKVIVKHLEAADLPSESFDLITFWEVLEHLPDPRLALLEARRLLRPNGIFLIMVPNVLSLVTRLLHDKSQTFGGHSHLNHFSTDTLTLLLKGAGLKILEMETVITELGAINNYLSFEHPYEGEAGQVLPELTPKMIHDRLWGSRLLVLATHK